MTTTLASPVATTTKDEHPSRQKEYILIALFLGFITFLEVGTYLWPDFPAWSGSLLTPVLLLMMAIKFWTVAWFFMHLKFDSRVLTWVFYTGLFTAVLVYVAVLSVFRIWYPGAHL